MPRVSVLREQIADGSLPSVCVVCGRDAPDRRFPDLATPPARAGLSSPLFVLLSFWASILIAARSDEDWAGGLPFCPRHRSYWTRRAWFIIGGWVFLIASMVIGILFTNLTNPNPPPHWTFVVAICWLLFFLPAFLLVHLASTRPIASSPDSITLAGASRKFVSAVEDEHPPA
jgi:hypothetical protein